MRQSLTAQFFACSRQHVVEDVEAALLPGLTDGSRLFQQIWSHWGQGPRQRRHMRLAVDSANSFSQIKSLLSPLDCRTIDVGLKATDPAGRAGRVTSVSEEKDTSFNVGAHNVTIDVKVYPDEFSLSHTHKKSST